MSSRERREREGGKREETTRKLTVQVLTLRQDRLRNLLLPLPLHNRFPIRSHRRLLHLYRRSSRQTTQIHIALRTNAHPFLLEECHHRCCSPLIDPMNVDRRHRILVIQRFTRIHIVVRSRLVVEEEVVIADLTKSKDGLKDVDVV